MSRHATSRVLRLSVSCLTGAPRLLRSPGSGPVSSDAAREWGAAPRHSASQCRTLAQSTRDPWHHVAVRMYSRATKWSSSRWWTPASWPRWPGSCSASPWPRWGLPPGTGPRRPPRSLSPHSPTCQTAVITSQQVSHVHSRVKVLVPYRSQYFVKKNHFSISN